MEVQVSAVNRLVMHYTIYVPDQLKPLVFCQGARRHSRGVLAQRLTRLFSKGSYWHDVQSRRPSRERTGESRSNSTLDITFHLLHLCPPAVACGHRTSRMFHGSGRYRAPVDSDDSYTSSSGEESLSDSPKRVSPDRYIDDTTESRKVRLVRGALDTAYRSVAVIEAPRKDISQEGQTPWKDLGQALRR